MDRLVIIFITLLFGLSSFGVQGRPAALAAKSERGVTSLMVPESYEYFLEKEKDDQILIPEKAKDSKSSGQFFSSVLDFHVQKYLADNPDSSFQKIKKFEESVNEGASLTTDSFKLRSKLNIAKGSAEVDIQYLLDYRIWFENQFSKVNAEVDLYSTNSTRFGIDFSSNREDTRTQLGFKIIW